MASNDFALMGSTLFANTSCIRILPLSVHMKRMRFEKHWASKPEMLSNEMPLPCVNA